MKENNTTPMMEQYLAIKSSHRDYLLFYRMGDFYELFFDDAIIAAKEIDIVLTKRGKHQNEDIPMCGVPVHSSEVYLHRLIKKGYSVAICEQIESPDEAKKRGYKAVVKREVIRIITPGTLLEDTLLEARESNYLASIAKTDNLMALALVDISTGEFIVETTNIASINVEISRTLPREIIVPDSLWPEIKTALQFYDGTITKRPDSIFDFHRSENRIKNFYGVDFLSGIGDFKNAEVIAAGAMLDYLEHTHKNSIPALKILHRISPNNFMHIDHTTRVNLEIERTVKGQSKVNSLLQTINYTITAAGGRLFSAYLHSPLANSLAIKERLEKVRTMVELSSLRSQIRSTLTAMPDIERAFARISAHKPSPRDFITLRDGLIISLTIAEMMYHQDMPQSILESLRQIGNFDGLLSELRGALVQTYNSNKSIRNGYNAQLDMLRELKENIDKKLDDLRDKYRKISGINTLKINHNNIIGYYIEISTSQNNKMDPEMFIHRQSMVSGVRYVTKELQQLESDIISCDDKIKQIEQDIFRSLTNITIKNGAQIRNTAQAIATIDVFCALAELAVQHNYVYPEINDSKKFYVVNGRHPVVEKKRGITFIANSCDLNDNQNVWLITAPNMAGKSTFLRQVALICLLAQMGSYVPADQAEIGVIDKLFSRIGAADNISEGKSTFMVEMLETASILNNATSRSLLILDEIGRGTATYDGLAIAEAVISHIHDKIKARTLFATHYHELTALETKKKKLACYTMKVEEWQGNIVFLHQVIKGIADKSYGVHIAELAGMPVEVIEHAYRRLEELVSGSNAPKQLDIFHIPSSTTTEPPTQGDSTITMSDLDKEIKSYISDLMLQIHEINPRTAMEKLWELHDIYTKNR